jgi:hypothetical protein
LLLYGRHSILTRRDALDKFACDLIINPAAYTAVDRAEEEPEIAFKINRDAPRVIAHWTAKHDISIGSFLDGLRIQRKRQSAVTRK